MKQKTRTQIIDELALEAMKAILQSVYLSPQTMVTISEAANSKGQSASLEVAERAYLMAGAMVNVKQRMNPDDKGPSTNNNK